MSVQYQRDARQPLPDPQQESFVQRIRQQIEAHPNLIAILVAAVGVGVAFVAYRHFQGTNSASSPITTDTGTTTSGTGGATAPTSTSTDTSGFQATIAALQNQVGALQTSLQTALAAIGTGSNGAADNSNSAGSTTVVQAQPIPVVSGIGSVLGIIDAGRRENTPQPPSGQLPVYGVSQGFTSVATASHLADQLDRFNAPTPTQTQANNGVVYNQPDTLPRTVGNHFY